MTESHRAIEVKRGRTNPSLTFPRASAKKPYRRKIDFGSPAGEPALVSPHSISWRVCKNPIALFIGGVTAVVLEFAEPKIRSGVWDHSVFRTDPIARMQRTGLATLMSVYGPRSKAERLIAGVVHMHDKVEGVTPTGEHYRANDPRLLDWVHCTASFGFVEAYSTFVAALCVQEKDQYYQEGSNTGRLFGALTAPTTVADAAALFQAMHSRFEPSPIIGEFLGIMMHAPIMPLPLRPLQRLLVRAGVEITPKSVREVLGLGEGWDLTGYERTLVRWSGWLADRIRLSSSAPVQACRRLGLPDDFLYTKRPAQRIRDSL